MTARVEFCLLGPLSVRCDEIIFDVQRGKQRALLATLLLKAGRTVSMDQLADALWGTHPPPSTRVTIRNYIKRLRRSLGPDVADRIYTQPPGYGITLSTDELDVSRFEALLVRAEQAERRGAWSAVADQTRSALALWRGDPLADIESDWLVDREAPRLAELRLQTLELFAEARLRLGEHRELVAELDRLTHIYPLREHLYALRIRALLRCGRLPDAVTAYQQARRTLLDEVGVEPGPELQDLQRHLADAGYG